MPGQIDAVCSAIEGLISKKYREEVFEYFYRHKESSKRFGWEKWFQVELAMKLLNDELGEFFFEVPHYYADNIRPPGKKLSDKRGYTDLEFRLKGNLRQLRTAVEIKLSRGPMGIRHLLNDFSKFEAFSDHPDNWNFRSVIGVLAYDAPKSSTRKTKFSRLICQLESENRCVVIRSHPHFHFVVIGWVRNRKKNMTHLNFKSWLDELKETCST